MQFDAEAAYRLAGRSDAIDYLFGPAFFDANDHDRRDVGVGAGADQRAKVQIEIGTKLQSAIGMRDSHHSFDVVRNGFCGRVRQIVDRQHDHMVAHTNAAVLAAVTPELSVHGNGFRERVVQLTVRWSTHEPRRSPVERAQRQA